VRDGDDAGRERAINKIQAIIDEEEAKAAERAAEKAKLKLEQAAAMSIPKDNGSAETEPASPAPAAQEQPQKEMDDADGAKDRSDEFADRSVGLAKVPGEDKGFNPCIQGTAAGRQLFEWLMTGKVGDLIADEVYPESDSESSVGKNDSFHVDIEKRIIVKKNELGEEVSYYHYYRSESGFSVRLETADKSTFNGKSSKDEE